MWRRHPQREQPAEPSAPAPVEHHSLVLAAALTELRHRGRSAILDLGPAWGPNVRFFGGFRCRLHVEDLLSSPGWSRAGTGPVDPGAPTVSTLGPGEVVDLVLAWDLLNYLGSGGIRRLALGLAPHVRPGTQILALVCTRGEMSSTPLAFTIQDERTLIYTPPAAGGLPCPRFKEPELLQLLPGYRVEATYLLRTGMQEYLFRYDPEE